MSTRIDRRLELRQPWRSALGIVLLVHAVAHSGAGIWASQPNTAWVAALMWCIATVGSLAAGTWLLGLVPRQDNWRLAAIIGSAASLGLAILVGHPAVLPGAVISLAVMAAAIVFQPPPDVQPRHPRLASAGTVLVALVAVYASAAILLRPWHTRWGSTDAELAAPLPGDDLVPAARYRVDHAITINAPADSVWPWLVQMGQDRAGFYSYAWLERAVGADIHNVNRIVPEWQHLAVGDLVRTVPPDYLGGLFGRDIGARVVRIVPRRAIVLDWWGSFVLVPLDENTTRLIVRTRGEGRPSLKATPIAPFGAFVFEPAHFIMERKMLLTIKGNAERGLRG